MSRKAKNLSTKSTKFITIFSKMLEFNITASKNMFIPNIWDT